MSLFVMFFCFCLLVRFLSLFPFVLLLFLLCFQFLICCSCHIEGVTPEAYVGVAAVGSVDDRTGGNVDTPALENVGVDDPAGNFGVSTISADTKGVICYFFVHGSLSPAHGSSSASSANSTGNILGPELI